ncbi:protein arginine methyltransferase NDUFAF7, mitochondrial isoform X2 [Pyxicephalus adspersus]|uniref:protein arginine methyltransferase NDUFAF7, mitochondrial isoform X2 n=1 Tax=Pyxicephalus adspersus TaxID=30357 RepID=UPI003B5A3E99
MSTYVRFRHFGRIGTHMHSVFAARNVGRYKSSKPEDSQEGNPLLKYLTMKITATGPITVAEYMREVLTNPLKGYYMHHDMLGEHGDFVTSPEISQIFGELIGIWCVSEWISGGKSKSLNLVELGPGRGSLMSDILRVFSQFKHLLNTCDISIHLVEVSPKLSEIQALNLTEKSTDAKYEDRSSCYKMGITKTGLPINWYYNIQDVPSGYTFYIAHEFFDALPIHILQKIQDEWREVLIDVDPEIQHKLRFVLGSSSSHIAKTFIKGFRSHQLHNVLLAPGTADLTADVDFNFLKRMIGNYVSFLGPITQSEFLRNMGIDLRLKVLLENAKDATTQQHLIKSYDVLMNPNKMGKRFQFFSLFPHSRLEQTSNVKYPIAGFTELETS